MSVRHVVIRPKAEQDLEEQAYYLAENANPEIGHRFLLAAHETFALLATQPGIGWHLRLRSPQLTHLRVFRISSFEKMLVLYLPTSAGIEIVRVIHGSRDLMALIHREEL